MNHLNPLHFLIFIVLVHLTLSISNAANPDRDSLPTIVAPPFFTIPRLPLLKPFNSRRILTFKPSSLRMSWLNKLGFGALSPTGIPIDPSSPSSISQSSDDDVPAPGQQFAQFAQFGAGCFWGVELAYQRVPDVTRTEVGYTQGDLHNPSYEDICSGGTNIFCGVVQVYLHKHSAPLILWV